MAEEILTPEVMEEFLESQRRRGIGSASLEAYRRNLKKLYDSLPGEKRLTAETGRVWKRQMEAQGIAPRSVNSRLSALNSLCEYLGRREFQIHDFLREEAVLHREYQLANQLKLETELQPELTRAEYLRLLQAARALEKERVYLLVKVLGGAGLRIQELPQLTVEAVKLGVVELEYHNSRQKRMLHLPEGLKEELLDFAKREGRSHGPVFSSSEGMPMARSSVNYFINIVCHDARVAEEKANPRCLWKMYQETCRGIRANIAVLIEQSYQKILEDEQLAMGWKEK